jgi:hypothetical protein
MYMNQAGLRRGLATSAVGALAISGLAVAAPSAQAVTSADVRLISQQGKVVSTRPDGSFFDEETRLVAERSDDSVGIEFEVNADPQAADDDADWVRLDGSTTTRGRYVAVDWSPSREDVELLGTKVAIRAVATDGVTAPAYSTLRDVTVTPTHDEGHGVHTTDFTGGYFQQPYASSGRTASLVGVAGTTSATDGTVALEEWRPTSASFQGLSNATVRPSDVKSFTATDIIVTDGGEFDAALPLAVFDAEAGEEVALRAVRDSDEVAIGTLHEQTIVGIRADSTPTADGSTVDLVVQAGDSGIIAGAEVRRADGTLVGYTDGAGVVTTSQPNESEQTYYVNTTDGDEYDDAVDFAVTVESDPFVATPTELRPVLADGPVFDDQEYAAGDVALQVVDQDGRPVRAALDIAYRFYPHDAARPAATLATTDAAGRIVVPFDPAATDGPWRLEATPTPELPVYRSSTFVSGDAALTLTPGGGQAASGGEITYTGRLSVGGRPLAGRTIELTYTRGTELVPGTGADAGIVVDGSRQLTATATTGADGTFTVRVDDPSEKGAPTEKGGRLTATARAAAETATATAQFGTRKGSVRLKLRGTSKGAAADRLVVVGTVASAGERVKVLVKTGKRWRSVTKAKLDRRGRLALTVKDRNGRQASSYVARLLSSNRVEGSSSAVTRLR